MNQNPASETGKYFRDYRPRFRVSDAVPAGLRVRITDALTLQKVALETDANNPYEARAVVRDIFGNISRFYSDGTAMRMLCGQTQGDYIPVADAELALDGLIHTLILGKEVASPAFVQEARLQLLCDLNNAQTVTHTVVAGKVYQRDMVDMLQVLVAVINPDTSAKLKELHACNKESYWHSTYWNIVRFNLLAGNHTCAMAGCQNLAEQLHHQDYSCVGLEHEEIYQPQGRRLAHVCTVCHGSIHLHTNRACPSSRDGASFKRFRAHSKFLPLAKDVLEEYVCC